MAYDIQDLRNFQDATGIIDTEGESLEQQDPLLPNTLAAILNPQEALEAAQRMQRWSGLRGHGSGRLRSPPQQVALRAFEHALTTLVVHG